MLEFWPPATAAAAAPATKSNHRQRLSLRAQASSKPHSRPPPDTRPDPIESPITLAAYHNLADVDVQKEFFTLVNGMTCRDGKLFRKDSRDLMAEEPLRQLFWREVVRRGLEVKKLAIDSMLDESGPIGAEDVRWLVDEVRATTGAIRAKWLELTLWQYAPVHFPTQLAWMQSLVDEDAEVAKVALSRTTSSLGGDEDDGENWQKKHYYNDLTAQTERAKKQSDRVRLYFFLSGRLGLLPVSVA